MSGEIILNLLFIMISKSKKQQILKELIDNFSKQKAVIFTDFTGVKTKELEKLRKELKKEGMQYQVAKKTLIDLALEKCGIKDVKAEELSGQIGIVFSYQDEVLPAKTVYEFCKNNENMKILKGIIDKKVVEKEEIEKLAKLPSKQELLAKLIDSFSSPLYGLIYSLQSSLQGLIFVLSYRSGKANHE